MAYGVSNKEVAQSTADAPNVSLDTGGLVEVAEQTSASSCAFLGDGDFPDDMDRMNWGAALFDWLWALAHGAWGWVAVLTVVGIASRVLFAYFYLAPIGRSVLAASIAAAVSELVFWGLSGALGMRANRIAWQHAQQRVAISDVGTRTSVESYQQSQRIWFLLGGALTALGYGASWLRVATEFPDRLVPTIVGTATAVVVLLTLWLWDRARTDSRERVPS